MIQTVPTRGYRFVATVTTSSRKLARRAQLEGASRLGPYRILKSVGGGSGKVYQAQDTRLDRTVAIKLLPPGSGSRARRKPLLPSRTRTSARCSISVTSKGPTSW